MREIAVSKFKATCLSVLEEVRRTGAPVRITKFGKPIAEVIPSRPRKRGAGLGSMRDSAEIVGDIVGPVGAFDNWKVSEK